MRTTLVVVAILVIGLFVIWTQQRRLMYFPFGTVPDPNAVGLTRVTPVTFQTSDNLSLNGWFITPIAAPRYTVIVFNGNAGNRAYRAPLAHALSDKGAAVFLFDYRGYGGNPGSPTEAGLKMDARAARDYVSRRPDVDPARLVYFGESLGAAVAARLAVDHRPAALILRSPFTSAADVARVHYGIPGVRWLLRDQFTTLAVIGGVRTPLFVIAGDRDRIVPADQSRRLYDAAGEPKKLLIIREADHNDASLQDGRPMIDAILQFLDAHVH